MDVNEEETIRRYEGILIGWYLNIRDHLKDNYQIPTRCEYNMIHIADELDYWENRLLDLEFITAILRYEYVTNIVDRLRKYQSGFEKLIDDMNDRLVEAVTEARSNLNYLQILQQPCNDLYNVESTDDVMLLLPDLFFKIIFIFEESPYYNKPIHFNNLCDYLANQIIFLCRKIMDTSILLDTEVHIIQNLIHKCLQCSELFIAVYNEVIILYNSYSTINLMLKAKNMHTFIRRCQDIKYIIKSKIVFKRLSSKNLNVPKPKFMFAPGKFYEECIENNERYFDVIITDLKGPLLDVFNVETSDWLDHMKIFQDKLKGLCIKTEQLTDMALDSACNSIACMNILQSLLYFSEWPPLEFFFRKKTGQLYHILIKGVNVAMEQFSALVQDIYSYTPTYSGICLLATINYKRIAVLKNLISNRPWLMASPIANQFQKTYSVYTNAYRRLIFDMFNMWWQHIDPNVEDQLQKHILIAKKMSNDCWTFTVNLHNNIYNIVREIKYWSIIGKRMPLQYPNFVNNASNIKRIRRYSTKVVKNYNYIIAGLSENEQLLFSQTIQTCVKTIKPLFAKYTWAHAATVIKYISKCYDALELSQETEDTYKYCNIEIVKLCEKIANTPLFKSTIPLEITHNFDNYAKNLSNNTTMVINIINIYNEIIRYVTVVYEGFEKRIKHMVLYWEHYVEKIDILILDSLLLNIRWSMKNIHAQKSYPMFLIRVSLDGQHLKYSPSLTQLIIYSERSCLDLALAVKSVPRLCHTFKITDTNLMSYCHAIAHDSICSDIQMDINKEIQHTLNLMKNYMSNYMIYSDIWTEDKRVYFKTFKASEPTADIFDQKLIMYKDYLNSIMELETEKILACIFIYVDVMKMQMIKHCHDWILNFSQILLDQTGDYLEHLYEYMELNSARVMLPPENLIEMVQYIEYQKKIILECDEIKENINLISDNVEVIEKHKIQMSDTIYNMFKNMSDAWKNYTNLLIQAELMLKEKQDEFQVMVLADQDKFREDVKKLVQLWEEYKQSASKDEELTSYVALKDMSEMENTYKQMKTKGKQLEADLAIFNLKYVKPLEFNVKKEMIVFKQIFNLVFEWDTAWKTYKTGNFWKINVSSMEITVQRIFKQLNNSLKLLKDASWKIIEIARNDVDAFRRILPLISSLKNPAMQPRHWDEVRTILNRYFDETDPNFTLEEIIKMQMQKYEDKINEVSNRATMELNIENSLKSIRDIWTNMDLIVEPYNDEGVYRIKASDEILQLLEDHLVQLYAMKGSKYISVFIKEADYWEKGLSLVMEVLDMTLSVQRQYLYAANIFKGEDIRSKIPKESEIFEKLTEEWKKITLNMYNEKNVYKACCSKSLLKQLIAMNEQLGEIQRALELYMETKRNIFPRFYFISNDDLLDILVNSNRPLLLQPHFKKCFDNINKLEFKKYDNEYTAIGMYSADGEYIQFTTSYIICEGPVEYWFKSLEEKMRQTLKDISINVMQSLRKNLKSRDQWILQWPGQLCITASQIQWTTNCTLALYQSQISQTRKPLKKIRKKQKNILLKFSDAIRGNLNKIDRLKIVALVTIEIHARDVIDKMYKSKCMDIYDFEWMSQLRFYYDKKNDDNIIIKQTNTEQIYGYEYLGNSGRLVITPLTDRCYITLTTALHLFRGGSPKGPAGTGKTETVKDLGKNLAYYVIVINCSEGLDYKSMERMFSGLAQQGAWGCFDEFNRINIEVLSVVAQQILSIYTALAAKLTNFMFVNKNIELISTCGIFITMNPGYAGRTELPDNLKSMFRAISMMVPDSKLIAEITLFGEGFRDTRKLANKVYVLFSLCRQQLSKQDHYEFGLRGLVALLRYAGQCRRLYSDVPDDEVLLLAMHNMNLAKLTVDDLPLFMGITNDLFPKISLPVVKNDILIDAIKRCMIKKNHQPSDSAIAKIVQLYETKVSRHSVMVLGYTGTAKTATWKTLRDAMTLLKQEKVELFETVIEYPLNPKALSLGELYGEYNLSTQEWMDGVLSSIMRKVCADNGLEQKWILFDGPVDAVWIENMNSVMDDNKVLTLINSERITMPGQVSLLFEVEDLAVASPATVSRCGIVYNDYKDFGWKLYVDSWLNNYHFETYKENIRTNFNTYLDMMLEFKKLNCIETVPLPELSSIESLCKLLECFTSKDLADQIPAGLIIDDYEYIIKIWFLFCMVWSVCAVVNEDGRKKIDSFLREKERAFPVSDTVYHYYVDTIAGQFRHWEYFLEDNEWTYDTELPFFKIIVPTIDTIRYNFLVEAFMQKNQPVLLVGPVGTGKTSTVQKAVDALDKNRFSFLTINMSAQTTSYNIQETIEGRLEKRTKDLFVPQANKLMVTFLDDMNMPEKEIYGAQPPLELIRQWIDYGFWFDRQTQFLKYVKKILLIGAMGPPGGGRNTISNRLISCFSMINLTFPEEPQITKIYKTMLKQHLLPFDENIQQLSNGLTEMTIALYKSVVTTLLPTPAKMHYLFNLRDISKVFQGLLRSNTDYQKSQESMLRLWCNEVFRVFNDKLIDEKDREWFVDQINLQLGKQYEMTYRNLCSSDRTLMFCDFLNKHALYEEVVDETYIRKFVENSLDEYNSSAGVLPMHLVLFKDAIDHVCRIVRVISQPRGYILLVGIGGSGRSSLSRLSNWICDYNMFTIELTKTYSTADFKEDLKSLYYQTGVKDQPTSFLFNDTQVVNESFLEIINNILSTGEVTKLYKDEEFDEIKDTLLDSAKRSGIIETTEAIYAFFLDRVRSNLHIVLCFSPIGNKFRTRLRQYPSLINCTTIDWFLDWPQDALLEVAFRSLTTIEILETITGKPRMYDIDSISLTESELRLCIANLFAIIHHSVVKYSNLMILELKRYNYVTPTNYLELVSGYKDTLRLKRIEIAKAANKLRNGLFKIEDTSEKVADMTIDLERATEIVLKYTEECDTFLGVIQNQTSIADQQKTEVDEKSIKIKEEEVECQKLYSLAKTDLEAALPALDEAMEALNALNKTDLAEVKSFSKPPYRVKLVMEAVMILKKSEPTWVEAKKQLGDPNFLTLLRDFDKDHISDKVLRSIGRYTRNSEFEPEKVGAQSIAAKSLAKWVIAIEKYAIIFKVVSPKRDLADAALASLNEKQLALATAQEKLAQLQELLIELKNDFDKKMKEKEQLVKKANDLKRNLERAATLIDGLSGERLRWIETVKQLDIDFDYLPGDCLLSIAFVSYMGPFVFKYRDILLKLWTKSIREMVIPCNPEFEIKDFLSDPEVIRNWSINGLPNDDFSTENGIIISRGSRWPLVIDPQCQALKWIKNMEADNNLKVIDFCLPNYMSILEIALQEGYPTLLQITSEHLEPAVMPILSKSIIKQGDQYYIKMGDKQLPYSYNFRFFITTKLRNPYYPPEIFTRATVVNFAIKEEGLEDQLLDVVIRMEKPELKELKDNLIINIYKGKKTLVELEDELLRLLNEIEGSLLENDELFKTLSSSKITSANVNEQLESSLITQAEINIAREGYRVCAKRASILFFVLNELNLIDPMYQFALDPYMYLFEISIEKSEKNENLVQRLENLNLFHTYAVYENTCRALFEVHKLLFSFQISISLLIANGHLPPKELEFLLKGGIVLNREIQTENPCPTWLPSSSWDNITELDKLPGFLGIEKSFEQYSHEWKEWYMSPNPETLDLIGKWNDNTNPFQKLLFIRCLRLDRLSFAISNYISDYLGDRFIKPPVLNLNSVLNDSTNKTPLIFLLSPGVDPTSTLINLASNNEKSSGFQSLSLGQGQSPIATQLIERGQVEGNWVFLANCHLSLSWMPELDKIIDVMQDGKSHPEFRLWLSSNPHPDFPIAILQNAIKMTTEPPKGLRANMKRLYQNITESQFSKCNSQEKYKKLLFSLCFFHSILIERKKFQNLGWNVIYSFNDSDFEISENLLSIYLDLYKDTPWNALKYLIAGICYGGHVTDDWDRRLLDTYINHCFNENAIKITYYKLSSLLSYYIPRDDNLQSYRDFIETLPFVDSPEVFGQHFNAEMASLMEVNRTVCDTLMVVQGQSSSVDEDNKEENVLILASKILSQLPEQMDYDATVKNIGVKRNPLDVVLLQEIQRYNSLLKGIKISLIGLRKGIKGLVVMSSDLEDVFQCVYDGRVPSQWLKAYPSLMPLGTWTQDLIKRVNHFTEWSIKMRPPILFWLGAYTYPTGFLTAVLQIHSRSTLLPIDLLNWDFIAINTPHRDIVMQPQEGVYVQNLYLEGANWNYEKSCLSEPIPLKFISHLPVMHFKPVQTVTKIKGMYQCPVYYYPQRCGTQGRDAFVVIMNLKSGSEPPDHWIKRSTAVLLNLSY